MEAFLAELRPLLDERAAVMRVMENYREHLRAYPDTLRSHALAILDYAWAHLREHRANIAALAVPAPCEAAMALCAESLDDLADGIESHALCYDPNEGGETMWEVGDMYLGLADRHLAECEQLLGAAHAACGPAEE